MKYLLDVNASIAYGFRQHDRHEHVARWMQSSSSDQFLTCSITELGFVRVLGNVRAYGMDVMRARDLLLELKRAIALPLEFIYDTRDVSSLPDWVQAPGQTTDGHLLELAKAHGAVLATLGKSIPGAFLVP